jgi:hypothetical protein
MATDIPDVDVVIPLHGDGTRLEAAVASAESQVAPGRVVVVDSRGAPEAVAAVAAAHPAVHFVRVEGGTHAAVIDAGLAATSDEFVLLLDPEAVLEDLCLRPLVSRARSNRAAGVIAPLLTHADGTTWQGSFGPFPGLRQTLVERVNLVTHRMSGGRTSLKQVVNGTTPVDWVADVCMLVRRSAIVAAGPMDETIGSHFEDVDWCRRMHAAGWTVLVEPMATAIFEPAEAAQADGPGAIAEYRAGFYRYCAKHKLTWLALSARIGLAPSRPLWPQG